MRATELVPILAEILDYPFDAAYRVDRALAEAGLRAKGKGRNLPEMSRKEALTFLIACMVTDKITKAADEVSPWLSACGVVNELPEFTDEWGDRDEDYKTGEEYEVYMALEAIVSPHKDERGAITLINYLLLLCGLIENSFIEHDQFEFSIDLTDLCATVINEEFDSYWLGSEQFSVIDPTTNLPVERTRRSTGIKRKCAVRGTTLKEIIART